MEPTLHCAKAYGCRAVEADRILVDTVAYKVVGGLQRGDIIVFKPPEAPRIGCPSSRTYVKRVIAVPGDAVPKRVARNSRSTVPPNHYVVLGDGIASACDSRELGSIPHSAIVGKVVLIYWPLSRLRWL